MGLIGSVKCPKAKAFFVDSYSGIIPIAVFSDALKSGRTAFIEFRVSVVLRSGGFSEVVPLIIKTAAVFVIYLVVRPSTGHVEKCESMRSITFAEHADNQIAVAGFGVSKNRSSRCTRSVPALPADISPSEGPSERLIVKHGKQIRMVKRVFHSAIICAICYLCIPIRQWARDISNRRHPLALYDGEDPTSVRHLL